MPGSIDPASGEYIYAHDDIRSPMHMVLNLGQNASKTQRAADRVRIQQLETDLQQLTATGTTTVNRTSNGSTPAASGSYAWSPVSWQEASPDELAAWNASNPSRLTAQVAGLYQVVGIARVQQTSSAVASMIFVNGAQARLSSDDAVGSSARFPVLKSEIPSVQLDVGGYIDLRLQTPLASQPILADRSYLYMRLLRSVTS